MQRAEDREDSREGSLGSRRIARRLLPVSGVFVLLLAWDLGIRWGDAALLPSPARVLAGLAELAASGFLLKHVVASLARVTWGWILAISLALPLGVAIGMSRRLGWALAPLLELLRPISPLAFIPIAILWFGVGDLSAVFIIFLASMLPLVAAVSAAVGNVPDVHLRAARNFGLGPYEVARRVVLPSILPQLVTGLRLSLGVAWLVVVAAEMIAVDSGLGFLIVDARNAGNRYDLVVAGMGMIGVIGLLLDVVMRRFEDAVNPGPEAARAFEEPVPWAQRR
jgi:NitT/TauT family transport system permease protein